ncbi:EAL domain-containing protein [Shewanella metallivivens]|uniref:EAL domain-containing protein n=1 Tax=Shewanella metallivivens TaxID=2872342 RepID=A0ABT5TL36_9GAMM|nr:EAL domain-containing protein [Shewanella metallivivens]MDD8059254.1 EAL domain-containing protein [Shewanella metallivivens]
MPKILLFICVCIFISPFAAAIETENADSNFDLLLNHTNYGVADGLSQDTVTAIVEDKEGYVWVGTINGLNRFDGNEFKQFYAGDDGKSLPSSFIRNLLIDDNGTLLVGTDKGLVEFNEETESFHPNSISAQIGDQAIWSISKQDNEILIGLNNKFLSYDSLSKKLSIEFESDNLKEIKNIIKFKNKYYIRNYEGHTISIDNGVVTRLLNDTNDIALLNNNIIAATNNGIFSINNDAQRISPLKFIDISSHKNAEYALGLQENNIIKIKINNKNITWEKVGELQVDGVKFAKAFIFENNETIYISNYNDGFITITQKNNLVKKINILEKGIWSLSKETDTFFMLNDDSDIYHYDQNMNLIRKIKTSFPHGPKSILIINKKIFIGTKSGLFLKDLTTNEETLISSDLIINIKYNKNEKLIYSSNFKGEIIIFSLEGKEVEKIKTNLNFPIYDMLKVDNQLWIASQAGLILWKNNTSRIIFNEDMVFNLALKGNNIYFGTRSAIFSTNKNKHDSTKTVLNRKKVIYSLSFVEDILVAASNREIYLINTSSNIINTLTVDNGVLKDYNTQSSLIINNNSILLGGIDGLSLINPKRVMSTIQNDIPKKISLTNLSLFNSSIDVGSNILPKPLNSLEEITLKHSDYPFTLSFNVIGENNHSFDFLYYLEDLEKNWLSTNGNNSVTYTNLSADQYTFKIYAKNKLSGLKTDIKNLKINITPPWWLSNKAKFIYGFLCIVLVITFFNVLNRRRQTQKQIALSEERLKLSLWGSGDEMWDWDIESGKIYRSNIWGSLDFPQDGRRSGNPDEESNIHPLDRDRVAKALNDHFNSITDHFEIAYRVKARNQQWIWILDRAKIVERDQKDQPLRMTGTIKDINNIKQAEEQLRLFARAIENISEGMFILNEKYQYVEVNEACCELTASTHEKYLEETLSFSRYPESYSEQIRTILKQQGRWNGEVEACRGTDDFFLMELTIDAIYNEQGETSHYVGVFSDITRRKQQEEELRKLTNNDLLTGLPNRSSLQVTLSNLVKKDIHHTLMVLDLDNFKRINDSLGHQIGDDLLIGVAERINLAIPEHASLYRLGGDEFALLVDQFPDIGNCAAIATKVINCLKPAFNINNESLVLGISIGIVLYPEDEQNEQALLRKADIAMYHAKSAGGNRYQFYSESLNQNALRQLEIENLIREALKDDLFEVYYQPKIDVKKDRLTGMEALVRLNHPTLGIIGPNEFIPLAEENGLIVEIGDVVLRKACFAAQKWLDSGLFTGRVAVNLSSKQFALADLQQRIESILRLTKLPAKHLELEITEGTVIKNPEQAIKVMQQLAKMGVSLALDDFGTGYSSLSYLKRFPINCLKIDKTFVDDIDKSDRDLKMVDSIITIAHNMGLSVVGEGVEQTAQLNILKALNCEEIQGYIYSKPIKETDFEAMLTADKLKHDSLTQTLMKK